MSCGWSGDRGVSDGRAREEPSSTLDVVNRLLGMERKVVMPRQGALLWGLPVVLLLGCGDQVVGPSPGRSGAGPLFARGNSPTLEAAFVAGDVLANAQLVPGTNGTRKLNAKGPYLLQTIATPVGGTCTPDISWIQELQAALPTPTGDINMDGLDKVTLKYASIIGWHTTINGIDFNVTFSDFGSVDSPTITLTRTADGKDYYQFRNGWLRVFKAGATVAQKCSSLDFDMTVK